MGLGVWVGSWKKINKTIKCFPRTTQHPCPHLLWFLKDNVHQKIHPSPNTPSISLCYIIYWNPFLLRLQYCNVCREWESKIREDTRPGAYTDGSLRYTDLTVINSYEQYQHHLSVLLYLDQAINAYWHKLVYRGLFLWGRGVTNGIGTLWPMGRYFNVFLIVIMLLRFMYVCIHNP